MRNSIDIDTQRQVYWLIKNAIHVNRWPWKDRTVDYIEEEIGWDNQIKDGLGFLYEYDNDDVLQASIATMEVIDSISKRQAGESVFERFAKENGIQLYTVDSNGNVEPYNPNSKLTEE